MKILIVCDQGNNRSVTIAGQLKYWGHDIITCGVSKNSSETLEMLLVWCDRVITTEAGQWEQMPKGFDAKHQLWNVGPDNYPRPYNPELLKIVKGFMSQYKAEYKA